MRRIVTETFEDGTSLSIVARRHDEKSDILFIWRRDAARQGWPRLGG
jgi:transposase-like protein